ncbi:tesmin isoform X2 [Notamacropus eugenii]|uniref:tesmin isoform X2 n=1 Tax=Notamacropus eugenii TaxID=9315 RepID=UPI003B685F6A
MGKLRPGRGRGLLQGPLLGARTREPSRLLRQAHLLGGRGGLEAACPSPLGAQRSLPPSNGRRPLTSTRTEVACTRRARSRAGCGRAEAAARSFRAPRSWSRSFVLGGSSAARPGAPGPAMKGLLGRKLLLEKENCRDEQFKISSVDLEDQPLLGGISNTEDEIVTEIFSQDSQFISENINLKSAVISKHDDDEDFHSFKDAYFTSADARETLLPSFNAPLNADCSSKVKVERLVDESNEEQILEDYSGLPELSPLEETMLPSPSQLQPHAYNIHFLSSLRTQHRNPASVLPLGAWAAREGAAHHNVRVIPVEIREAVGAITATNQEEAVFQNAHAQESCCKFPPSQEPMENSSCSHKKESNPMVICQLKGGTQMLCINNSGTRELKAVHLVPQYQEQNNYLQPDVPKPLTTLVGRFLPVPAKLNLITQNQLDNGTLSSVVNGTTFPSGSNLQGPGKITLAGYCDCFANGDFCNNCNCNNCYNNLRHEIERFKAIKACLDRNPEAFQPKIGKGKLGDIKPRHNKGCNCKRSGCLKNYCECYEAKIMCSSICKCIGCKNYEESPERKTLLNMSNYVEIGGAEGSHLYSPSKFAVLPKFRKDRQPYTCISWEVVEAACACLLAQGEEAEKEHYSECLAEQMILEEFGRCLSQILHTEFKSKGLKVD